MGHYGILHAVAQKNDYLSKLVFGLTDSVKIILLSTNTNALNPLTCHCEPGGRGNPVFQRIPSSFYSSQWHFT